MKQLLFFNKRALQMFNKGFIQQRFKADKTMSHAIKACASTRKCRVRRRRSILSPIDA